MKGNHKRAVLGVALAATGAALIGWALSPSGSRILSSALPALRETAGWQGSPRPRPVYRPQDVVRLQVEALGDNDRPYPDAGIGIAFRFASPANRKVTGPLQRFVEMVHNPLYRPLLNHRGARYGKLKRDGDEAFQAVILTAREGGRAGYLFRLSRQTAAPFRRCWMTDSVTRFEVGEDERQV